MLLVWIEIWDWSEVVSLKSKEENERNERNDKEDLKNHILCIRMTMQVEPEEKNVAAG